MTTEKGLQHLIAGIIIGHKDKTANEAAIEIIKALKEENNLNIPHVSGTFCEKCNPNGIEDGNVIRCKKCGRGLALIEQNYH